MANTQGYCVNLNAALEKGALHENTATGATQLAVGQSKAEDRFVLAGTSACRECTEALEQAAEGNA